jgi:hypothetical protein
VNELYIIKYSTSEDALEKSNGDHKIGNQIDGKLIVLGVY